ncbi:FAD-binding protein [Streptomyces sp. NBC_00582]|uniref:FAD-binding protein n=1 Tax=Streptomyces sp. NBC_00582 TaxID=2975783 RepID=UPI0010638412|nr:FAD-binding protein [Streptomyces sp. NBC_00582]WUB59216.1 FAD-binding protein [Streptomyces sp. NBC_00582]
MTAVVLLGGRGVGGPENFGLLARCAGLLDAPWGATRAAIDAGWAPAERLVGASGQWFRAGTAVLFGVSGSLQHTVAVRADRVLAINTDPGAVLMAQAEIAVCADAGEVLGALAARLEERGASAVDLIPQAGPSPAGVPHEVCGPPPPGGRAGDRYRALFAPPPRPPGPPPEGTSGDQAARLLVTALTARPS